MLRSLSLVVTRRKVELPATKGGRLGRVKLRCSGNFTPLYSLPSILTPSLSSRALRRPLVGPKIVYRSYSDVVKEEEGVKERIEGVEEGIEEKERVREELIEEEQENRQSNKPLYALGKKPTLKDITRKDQYFRLNQEDKDVVDRRKVYNEKIFRLRKQGLFAEAITAYKEMKEAGLPPDHLTYSNVLSLYSIMRRVNPAETLWEKIVETIEFESQVPNWTIARAPRTMDAGTLNAMLGVYTRVMHIESAVKFYNDMKEVWGIEPNSLTLTTLLTCLSKSGKDLSTIERIYFEFKQKNPGPSTTQLYTILINAYGMVGQWQHVSKILSEMKEYSLVVDPALRATLVKRLIHADETSTSELVAQLAEMGALETHGYRQVARDLTTQSEALELLQAMQVNKAYPDIETFNTLLGIASNNLEEARQWVGQMERIGLKANAGTYKRLFMLAATPASPERAPLIAQLTSEIAQLGILPTEEIYAVLIRFYEMIGDPKRSEELLGMLRANNPILTPALHNIAVKLFANAGPYHKLLDALQEVKDHKIALKPKTIDILFSKMVKKGRLLDFADLLKFMIKEKQNVQISHLVGLYNAVLDRASNGILNESSSVNKTGVGRGLMEEEEEETITNSRHNHSSNNYSSSSSSHSPSSTSTHRTPGHVAADLNIITQLHTSLVDTPGSLARMPPEYWVSVLSAQRNSIGLTRIVSQALNAYNPDPEKVIIFVEFLKLLDKMTLQFAHDVEAWKGKLVGKGRENPSNVAQFKNFVKYVQTESSSPYLGSRANKPLL